MLFSDSTISRATPLRENLKQQSMLSFQLFIAEIVTERLLTQVATVDQGAWFDQEMALGAQNFAISNAKETKPLSDKRQVNVSRLQRQNQARAERYAGRSNNEVSNHLSGLIDDWLNVLSFD